MLRLALASRRETSRPTANERPSLVPQLRSLADQLVAAIQAGQMTQARKLARQHMLPPIAWGFLASCLQKQQIPADVIEGVLS